MSALPASLCVGQFRAGQADTSKRASLSQVAGAVRDAGICIAVLKELVTAAGKDSGTRLENVFPAVTGQGGFPLASSLVCNSQRAINLQ